MRSASDTLFLAVRVTRDERDNLTYLVRWNYRQFRLDGDVSYGDAILAMYRGNRRSRLPAIDDLQVGEPDQPR